MDIVSFAHFGYEGEIIKVEADLRRGIPAVDMVGLPDGAVKEARERMRAAVRNSGFEFPRDRILINLSPADLRKEGSSFDLPIALAVLSAANGMTHAESDLRVMVLGELELSGTVRPVKGVLAAVSRGLECGIRHYIVPAENLAEAEIRDTAVSAGVHTLNDAYFALASLLVREARVTDSPGGGHERGAAGIVRWRHEAAEFSEVRGQQRLVRSLQIAAAGGHHLVAYGPPGSGKTLALSRFPALLPLLDGETAVTVTRIHSLAGFPPGRFTDPVATMHAGGGFETGGGSTGSGGGFDTGGDSARTCSDATEGTLLRSQLLTDPPFREPHPNASLEGIAGGGRLLRPGEISLAHGGVLFLDEAAQFRTTVLQALRSPLETGTVTVSRAGKTAQFPARFQLLMAMNPCPCGNYAAKNRICTCSPEAVEKYWRKLGAPLLDRIDLRVAVETPDPDELTERGSVSAGYGPTHCTGQTAREAGTSTTALRTAVKRARKRQWARNRRGNYRYEGMEWLNARLTPADIARFCTLTPEVQALFSREMRSGTVSARGGHGILKVARTIADMEGSDPISAEHLAEAASFRRWGVSVPDFLQDF